MLNGFGFRREIGSSRYFQKVTDREGFSKKMKEFQNRVEKALSALNGEIPIKPMDELELRGIISEHYNGYEPNKVSSPFFHPEYIIGRKHFAVYGLDEDINQKDGDIDLAVINTGMSSEISEMYESYMARFGHNFGHEHVLNTFIFYDNQASIKKMLGDNKSKLNIIKSDKDGTDIQADRVSGFLSTVEKDSAKVVRTHFNISLFDRDRESLHRKEQLLQGAFAKAGIVPTEFNHLDTPYLFMANTPGCGGHLPREYSFITILDIALIYTLYEGTNIVNDEKGIVYANRTDNIPFVLDTFFRPYDSKLIENRNYFVIAPSGGGKSFSSRSRLYQQYKMGFDQVVINIGGDDKLVKLINKEGRDEALYIEYKDGQTLPINPFYVEGYVNNSKIEFLIEFLWLLWGGEDKLDATRASILNKIIYLFYNIDQERQEYVERIGYRVVQYPERMSLQGFYRHLETQKEKIKEIYDGNKEMFDIDSLLINLEKFAKGSYSYLFSEGKPALAEGKKFIEFELDNIKDHPFLFPIFSMLISDITFNTMWKEDGYKDFFVDECWKILEKPGMAVLLKYLFKTIRKFTGSVGISVQQITDIGINEIIEKAILGNCAIKYILRHKNVIDQVPLLKQKLSLKESDVAMLLSIKNKTEAAHIGDSSRYTEQLLIMGSDFSKIVRNEVSPELAVIYDSEKDRLRRFNELYRENLGDIEKTVIEYLKK